MPQGQGGSWTLLSETRYIYDGNRVIQERDVNNVPLVTYTRGPDLSGTFEGAGGIGGLLARSHGYSSGIWSTHNFYHCDGNGNITAIVNASQSVVASYRYDPFGNMISKSGTLADANVYRFSSKEIHLASGMYYYLFRFYDPNSQRWCNRDPAGERAGPNLHAFVENAPTGSVDPLGLQSVSQAAGTGEGLPGGYGQFGCKDSLFLEFVPKSELGGTLSRWRTEPAGTLYAESAEAALGIVQSRFGRFDANGECCKGHCIRYLSISAHGHSGSIQFSPGKVDFSVSNFQYDRYQRIPVPEEYRPGLRQSISDYLSQLALLQLLASKMCTAANAVFVVCDLGGGDFGDEMRSRLATIFPPGTALTLPSGAAGFLSGSPYNLDHNRNPTSPLR